MFSVSQRPLPDNTQHSKQTDIHAPRGIETHNLSRRAAVNLCLRPCGHWDRYVLDYTLMKLIKSHILSWALAFVKKKKHCNIRLSTADSSGILQSYSYLLSNKHNDRKLSVGCPTAQVVSHWPLIAEARFIPRPVSVGFVVEKVPSGQDFLPKFGFPLSVLFH